MKLKSCGKPCFEGTSDESSLRWMAPCTGSPPRMAVQVTSGRIRFTASRGESRLICPHFGVRRRARLAGVRSTCQFVPEQTARPRGRLTWLRKSIIRSGDHCVAGSCSKLQICLGFVVSSPSLDRHETLQLRSGPCPCPRLNGSSKFSRRRLDHGLWDILTPGAKVAHATYIYTRHSQTAYDVTWNHYRAS